MTLEKLCENSQAQKVKPLALTHIKHLEKFIPEEVRRMVTNIQKGQNERETRSLSINVSNLVRSDKKHILTHNGKVK